MKGCNWPGCDQPRAMGERCCYYHAKVAAHLIVPEGREAQLVIRQTLSKAAVLSDEQADIVDVLLRLGADPNIVKAVVVRASPKSSPLVTSGNAKSSARRS